MPADADFEQAVGRGGEALKRGQLDTAIHALRDALELQPGSARVLALLGLAHFRGGHLDAARPIYEDLVEKLPTDASHRLNLGLVYLKLGDADRAIHSLEASRALDPGQGRAVSYLGLAYARAGRYAEAYRSFLLAGQNDLATEVQDNLTAAERDGIHAQLGRTPSGPLPGEPAIAVSRTRSEPRTRPPSAPPGSKARTSSQDLSAPAAAARAMAAAEPPAAPAGGIGMRSMAAIVIDRPFVDDAAPAPSARMSESMQFVIGRGEIRSPDAARDVSQAVAAATPAAAAATAAAARPTSAVPLSQLATTELVRPDDGDEAFELAAGGQLIIRVTSRLLTRLDGVHVSGGELSFEPATRRSRGHQTDEPFDYGGAPLFAASGTGYLIALSGDRTFTAVTLDDDILYVREDLVFAFESTLRWESGNVPGLRGQLPVVQFRGDGAVALRIRKPLVRVKLPPSGVVLVDASHLAGWIGRVIPRAVVTAAGGPLGEIGVECTGEGIVLVDPVGTVTPVRAAPRTEPPAPPAIQSALAESAAPASLLDDLADTAEQPAATDEPPAPATSPQSTAGTDAVAELLGDLDDDTF